MRTLYGLLSLPLSLCIACTAIAEGADPRYRALRDAACKELKYNDQTDGQHVLGRTSCSRSLYMSGLELMEWLPGFLGKNLKEVVPEFRLEANLKERQVSISIRYGGASRITLNHEGRLVEAFEVIRSPGDRPGVGFFHIRKTDLTDPVVRAHWEDALKTSLTIFCTLGVIDCSGLMMKRR